MDIISQKICLLGDYGVGKTSLINRFVDAQFSDQYLATVGVKISCKLIEISASDGTQKKNIQLLIWDVEGQNKIRHITPNYLRGAKGAIVVADLSRQETIDRLKDHITLFSGVNPKAEAIIVALNKSDLFDESKLEKFLQIDQLQNFPKVIATYPTSAKTGKNVDKLFYQLAHRINFFEFSSL